jgi:hypothetical protein
MPGNVEAAARGEVEAVVPAAPRIVAGLGADEGMGVDVTRGARQRVGVVVGKEEDDVRRAEREWRQGSRGDRNLGCGCNRMAGPISSRAGFRMSGCS